MDLLFLQLIAQLSEWLMPQVEYSSITFLATSFHLSELAFHECILIFESLCGSSCKCEDAISGDIQDFPLVSVQAIADVLDSALRHIGMYKNQTMVSLVSGRLDHFELRFYVSCRNWVDAFPSAVLLIILIEIPNSKYLKPKDAEIEVEQGLSDLCGKV